MSALNMDIPKMDIPQMDIPKMDTPNMDIPRIDLPLMNMPKLDIPKMDMPCLKEDTVFSQTKRYLKLITVFFKRWLKLWLSWLVC